MTEIVPQPFHPIQLIGTWDYVDAHVELANGNIIYNFGPNPVGRFIIKASGHYSHIVMRNDLPVIAGGSLRSTTPEEADVIAKGVLSHYGSWSADGPAGEFTVQIAQSSFAAFNGISQLRFITKVNVHELEYVNTTVTNGGDAKVFAKLARVFP
jgi:Lipocalin-like domain